jgi:hypothetical protein
VSLAPGIPEANGGVRELDREMTELLLLLPAPEVVALEQAARRHELTLGQLVRRLIRDFLDPGIPLHRG